MDFPKESLEIISFLEEHGFEGFIVGGAVRDSLLKLPIHDIDICTDARPEEIQEIFQDHKTIDVGKQFGTIRLEWQGDFYEVTTYRWDGDYKDGRHPESVEYSKRLSDDLQRRDFTINAMAYNPKTGFVDLFSGQEDLKKGIIRAVGKAEDRMKEDALRILRAIRFAARLDFSIEKSLAKTIVDQRASLKKISVERILEEMDKMLLSKNPDKAIMFLDDFKLLPLILGKDYRLDTRSLDLLKVLPKNLHLVWASLYRYSRMNVKKSFRALKPSNRRQALLQTLLAYGQEDIPQNLYGARKLMGELGEDFKLLYSFLYYESACFSLDPTNFKRWDQYLKEIEEKKLATSLKDLAIDGEDLLSMGFKAGAIIGQILSFLFEEVLQNRVENKREDLLEAAKTYFNGKHCKG